MMRVVICLRPSEIFFINYFNKKPKELLKKPKKTKEGNCGKRL